MHSQRVKTPEKWRKSNVMTERWRLVNGTELYDIKADPGQEKNVADTHPEVFKRLRGDFDGWWKSLEPLFARTVRIGVGSDHENPAFLMSHDWHTEGTSPWHQGHVNRGVVMNGPWTIDVDRAGEYEISLLRWPSHTGKAMDCTRARLKVGDFDKSVDLSISDTVAKFRVTLPKGPADLQTWIDRSDGKTSGAYFVEVLRVH